MLFKNAIFYKLTENVDFDKVEEQLAQYKSSPPGRHSIESIGFSPVFQDSDELAHVVKGDITFCLKKYKKSIPEALKKELLAEKIKRIEQKTGESVPKAMRNQLKQEVINHLAEQIPASPTYIFFTFLSKHNLIVVNATAFNNAELCLAMLRKALGSLPVEPLIKASLAHTLTHWCFDKAPKNMDFKDKGKLFSLNEEKSEISFKRETLDADELITSKESGKLVKEIEFEYDEKFSATISEDGKLRAIKLSDMCLDDYYAIPKDSVAAAFDCSRVIMNETLSEFVTFLEKELANMGLGIS
tara:strand:+ start:508 stop:1407 length:900 start_codon:yes stop_codon:yes gene_type:complete